MAPNKGRCKSSFCTNVVSSEGRLCVPRRAKMVEIFYVATSHSGILFRKFQLKMAISVWSTFRKSWINKVFSIQTHFYLFKNGKLVSVAADILDDTLVTGENLVVDQFIKYFDVTFKFGRKPLIIRTKYTSELELLVLHYWLRKACSPWTSFPDTI